MKRLLIVADHAPVVRAIKLALRQTAGFQIIGFVDGRRSISAHLEELAPDVIIVDDMQCEEHALERLREIARITPNAKASLLTARMDDAWVEEVFEAGAQTVLSKALQPVALGTLLRETVERNVIHRYERRRAVEVDCPLTSREVDVLVLTAQGCTNGAIARQLWITEQTVKFHLSNTYRKLGVANRTEASRYAYLHALVTPSEPLAV